MRVWQALSVIGCFVWSVNCYAINPEHYQAKKAKGTITVTKQGNQFLVVSKQFNPETGERIADEHSSVTLPQLEGKRDALQAQMDALTVILEDLNAL